tara:strand:- start:2198 stop:2398 length:201 start_codon:yes stop_codon:yes gene_type:complete
MNSWKEKLGCDCPEKSLMNVQYNYKHKERYDGVSEITCLECKKRVGRWSGKVLKDNEFENRFGRID